MASKLYPTLSAFYKAGHVGFGSEEDAILCGVPEEKLYRKPSRQRPELPPKDVQLDASPTTDNRDAATVTAAPIDAYTETTPLTPSAPPLLEMLDARLQQYLDALLASKSSEGATVPAPQATHRPVTDNSTPPDLDPCAGAALTLPPNVILDEAWLDELQPDYDDLTPEEMADEILNNLDVGRDGDAKDHEKSLSLVRLGLGLGLPIPELPGEAAGVASAGQAEDRPYNQKHYSPQQHHHHQNHQPQRHRHHYQHQRSLNSSEGNESAERQAILYPQHQNGHHHHHHHQSKSRHAKRPQSGGDEELQQQQQLRAADKTRRQGVTEPHTAQEAGGRDRRREAGYPTRRPHAGHRHKHPADPRSELVSSTTDLQNCGQRDARRPSTRAGAAAAEKENVSGSSGKPKMQGDSSDYNAWMTWRKQVNRQLATIILLKQQGRQVRVQSGDMRRKPLRQSSIDFVSQIATQTGSSTSLGGKPYVMYGIPRASLLSTSMTNLNKRDS